VIDNAHIRHRNFMKLFNDFMHAQPQSSRHGMLKRFAERLGFSERYLSHLKCHRKNIGTAVARTIEARLKLPYGWLDREHDLHAMPVDDREKLFVATALSLFRAQPNEARDILMQLLRQSLGA
jgi:hypothetical protein